MLIPIVWGASIVNCSAAETLDKEHARREPVRVSKARVDFMIWFFEIERDSKDSLDGRWITSGAIRFALALLAVQAIPTR
jgi:hypothetical protein